MSTLTESEREELLRRKIYRIDGPGIDPASPLVMEGVWSPKVIVGFAWTHLHTTYPGQFEDLGPSDVVVTEICENEADDIASGNPFADWESCDGDCGKRWERSDLGYDEDVDLALCPDCYGVAGR